MARKPKVVGVGKPKKITVAAPPKQHPYIARYGTPNELGPERGYATMPKAKAAMVTELEAHIPWCKRYNNAGLEAIGAAIKEVDAAIFHNEPQRIECVIDEHYDVRFTIEYRSKV